MFSIVKSRNLMRNVRRGISLERTHLLLGTQTIVSRGWFTTIVRKRLVNRILPA